MIRPLRRSACKPDDMTKPFMSAFVTRAGQTFRPGRRFIQSGNLLFTLMTHSKFRSALQLARLWRCGELDMVRLTDFWRDRRGAAQQTLAISAALVALASVAASSLLERMARDGSFPTIAFIDSRGSIALGPQAAKVSGNGPIFNSIDHTVTGSISRPIILDPCTGKQK